MMERGAYPSPYNYFNFPKSVCTSINEVRVEKDKRREDTALIMGRL
jgi:hypothetical protein